MHQNRKYAMSRIMIASAKMRYFRLRGGGEDGHEAEDIDEINVCNAHLHCMTAKKDLIGGAKAYKRFWDLLSVLAVAGTSIPCDRQKEARRDMFLPMT